MSSNESSPEATLPTYSPDGVDLTLIRWMLTLTPLQRLQVLQHFVRSVLELRARNPSL